jgi:hydroxymethylglutaryl-CoA synthase
MSTPGVSGLSLYVPKLRVPLSEWSAWTGAPAEKVEAIVGRSFRVCGPGQSVYTMAAAAVLDLIVRYDVDPRDVGFLGFGTESSTDNAAGAVLIRGMIDDALFEMGRPPLSRSCEVPEFKHACLGGVYGLKAAARYLSYDGRGRRAIVVSADIAEYERGSTGEQTQGAGAVAMLLDAKPEMFTLELDQAGSSSAYRGVDFRKPFARHRARGYAPKTDRMHDFPVFNGKYSTVCYVDATVHALDHMFRRMGGSRTEFFDEVAMVVCHRPYHHMPQQAMAASMVWSMARELEEQGELVLMCEEAGIDPRAVLAEVGVSPDLFTNVRESGVDLEPYPAAMKLSRHVRKTAAFKRFLATKMHLGEAIVRDLGNLYTASLPAWLGAALEDAFATGEDLTDKTILAIGYGSGDAAEAIPLTVVPGWERAAAKLGFAEALREAIDLDREQYEALHDGRPTPDLPRVESDPFVIDRVGESNDADFQDVGIEYYRFAGMREAG